jgi:hypothetical protein
MKESRRMAASWQESIQHLEGLMCVHWSSTSGRVDRACCAGAVQHLGVMLGFDVPIIFCALQMHNPVPTQFAVNISKTRDVTSICPKTTELKRASNKSHLKIYLHQHEQRLKHETRIVSDSCCVFSNKYHRGLDWQIQTQEPGSNVEATDRGQQWQSPGKRRNSSSDIQKAVNRTSRQSLVEIQILEMQARRWQKPVGNRWLRRPRH